MSMGGPNSGKAARITQELQRKIRDSPNPSERLEEVCQILLKLEDEKLNRIVEDISERQDKYLQYLLFPCHRIQDREKHTRRYGTPLIVVISFR